MPATFPPFLPRRRGVLALGAASAAGPGLLSLLPGSARAADAYPNRPIRVVVGYPPGGGADLVTRVLVDGGLSRELGQPMIIDNKPGAGTVIGTDFVAKAPADGYTLLVNSSSLTINATLTRKLPYDSEKDLAPVSLLCSGPNVLVCLPDRPWKTLADVIAAAKANPGKLTYGSAGNGTTVHLAGELLKMMAGIDLTHVPYKGAAPSFTDLLGGQVDFVIGTSGGVSRFIESGKMRAIAITTANRSPVFPGVATFGETVPGYAADIWYGMFAPAGTPPDVVARLNAAVKTAAEAPAYSSRMKAEGLLVSVSTPQEMRRYIHEDIERWRKVIVAGNITAS
ncbi:MAG: tripartite tricarboxylate transporter substrate binding protein [Pseudomonadota bacterium]